MISVVTLAEVKQQCRLEPDDDQEDMLLTLYIKAARHAIEQHTDRELVESLPEESTARHLVITEDIRLATLLIIGHWFNNRESVSDFEKTEVPLAFGFLLSPHRRIPI